MADPGRDEFTTRTPAVLRELGYRVRVLWSAPNGDEVTRRMFPVLFIERAHLTAEQYEALREYARAGGGLVLVGYAANWLDADGNQRRDRGDPEITGEHGSGGLVDIAGAARSGLTYIIRELQPVTGDPLCDGVDAQSWNEPGMRRGGNVVTLKPTTGTVACRMVRQYHDWSKGAGDVEPGLHDLVVRREAGAGRVVWLGWTGIVNAARQGQASARRLLRNAVAWTARDTDLTAQANDGAPTEAKLWEPEPGRFAAAFDQGAPPATNNVETMLCHFTGRWHKLFGPPAQFAQWLADRHVEIIRVNVAACSRVLYAGSEVANTEEWPTSREYRDETGRDLLADLVDELHRRGIQLCGDYNHFSDRYRPGGDLGLPRAMDREGKPSNRYYCWLSPAFARRTQELVTELFSRYALDSLVIEDDKMPACYCEACLDGYRRFCAGRGVAHQDPRQMDAKKQPVQWRLFARFRASRYYAQVVGPMRDAIHAQRPDAKLGVWVGRWMRETHNGYSQVGIAPFVDFEWHMAYVDPPGVADAVCSDLANITRFGTEAGAAMSPKKGNAQYTISGLTAALESGASVIGVYPQFIKTAADPGYDGMAQVFARAEAMWADRYERRLASLGSILMLCAENELPAQAWRVRFAEAGLDLRAVRLYDDGRRISELKPVLADAQVVLATHDLLLSDDDLAELERFVRAGGGLYVVPWALRTRPELIAGDIVAKRVERGDVDAWLKRFGVRAGATTDVSWLSLRSDRGPLAEAKASLPVFSSCLRLEAAVPSVSTVGRATADHAPVLCAGELGKGRVACFGGLGRGSWSATLLPQLCLWLARAESVRVTGRRIEGQRAIVTFTSTGERPFAGPLGIALPATAAAGAVTVNGKAVGIAYETRWGSLRYAYVPVEIAPGGTAELAVISDRPLVDR